MTLAKSPARTVPLLFPLLPLLIAQGATPAWSDEAPERASAPALPFSRMQLQNGLEVIVHEDHTVPIVAVSIWYRVGSKDEEPGRRGFAHLCEHMMFQGSQHVRDDMHFKLVQEAGGALNGTTTTDRTSYYAVVPSNFLERVLYLESDRMGFLLPTLTQKKLDSQREVVRDERRQRFEMVPYGMHRKYLAEALYPKGHPYHHTTIGEHEDLAAATLDDVRAFFKKYYVPENAALVIAGDVTTREARRLADRWFGPLPKSPSGSTVRAARTPALGAEVALTATDRVKLPRLYLAWHSPARFQPGDAELDLLSLILGGRSGRLYKRLVYRDRLAQSVEVSQESRLLSSVFTIVVTAREDKDLAKLKRIVDEELRRLRRDGPTRAEMERARNQYEARFFYDLQSLSGGGGRAELLQEYLALKGDPGYLEKDLMRYRGATSEGVRKALQVHLGPGRVALSILPGERQALAGDAPGEGGR